MRGIVNAILALLKGIPEKKGEPRADMFLPRWIMVLGVFLALCAVGALVAFAILLHWGWLIAMAVCAILSAFALMCWVNQKIIVLNDEYFQYVTFTGTKKKYRFADIKGLRKNSDSLTLFVGKDKVHIESAAIISDRLIALINESLKSKSE
ncbi:MAG: hypothetical protein IJY88_03415 [Clostridia bacterium]|nr:hypothetical protein [Clostridia bacterium]